jgi:hypothetical protein
LSIANKQPCCNIANQIAVLLRGAQELGRNLPQKLDFPGTNLAAWAAAGLASKNPAKR